MFRPAALAVLLLVTVTGCAPTAPTGGPSSPVRVVTMPVVLTETSGLAASHRADDLLWAHNDSGGEPVLYAVDLTGRLRGQLRLTGVTNTDWEDIASFELDGRAWLLAADVGDNDSRRHDCALYVVPEPDPAALTPGGELATAVAWRVPVRFPDGPRDCEAVAVDSREGRVYLLSKRTVPAVLYSLPLRPAAAEATTLTATRLANITQIAPASGSESVIPLPAFKYHNEPTGLDFAPDGSAAVVLTYGGGWLFPRRAGQTWTEALAGMPARLAFTGLVKAEGVCFSRDGHAIFVTSEGKGAPLLRFARPAGP